MTKFLLWLILLVVCWPLALLALVLYPIVWLLLLPFRLIGITADALFSFLKGLLLLPARVLRGPATEAVAPFSIVRGRSGSRTRRELILIPALVPGR